MPYKKIKPERRKREPRRVGELNQQIISQHSLMILKIIRSNSMNISERERTLAFLKTEEIQDIIKSKNFYFLKARDAFEKLMEYNNRQLIEEIISWTYAKQRKSDRDDVKGLLGLINRLVAYCDTHAFNKAKLNEYEDNRVLARANIRQNAWIKQLLQYKIDKSKCTPAILNTVNYILKPDSNINILSEEHRCMISQLLLKKEYIRERFVRDICEYFQELDIQLNNPYNRTHLYSRLIYHLSDIWCDIVKGLVARDRTEWKDKLDTDFKNGAKCSVTWWHELPQPKSEILPRLKKTIAKDGHFDFYYVENNQAVYKATVEDFVGASEYSQKMEEWKRKNPVWFSESLDEYVDESKQAKILFLSSHFERLQTPIPLDLFKMYKDKFPVRAHLGAFSEIEQIEINTMVESLELEKQILRQKKQIILQGAPGTGKTYSTAALALSVLGVSFNPNDHNEIMALYDQQIKENRIYFTTFHQSMGYEDFVEGLKPVVADNGKDVLYKVEDGIFKNICMHKDELNFDEQYQLLLEELKKEEIKLETKTDHSPFIVKINSSDNLSISSGKNLQSGDSATSITREKLEKRDPQGKNFSYIDVIRDYMHNMQQTSKPRVLIIDEINRGNISKIFGELITLLEADKRQGGEHPVSAILPYSKEEFLVPSNIYIIGTMNTTDRSTGRIDYAVRRRFAFFTLEADVEAIESYYKENSDLGEKANLLFNAVKEYVAENKTDDLEMEELMVGHSYFMAPTAKELRLKFRYEIVPLLKEYEKDGMLQPSDEFKTKTSEWESLLD